LNALVAEDLPGPGTVFLEINLKFTKAAYIGDTITGRVEIKTVRKDKPICTIDLSIKNQKGDVCVRGIATTYTAPFPTEISRATS
jgi:acyl dehydratase